MKQILLLFIALIFSLILSAQKKTDSIKMSKKSVTNSIRILSAGIIKSKRAECLGVEIVVQNTSKDLLMSGISIHFLFYGNSNKLIKDSLVNWSYKMDTNDISQNGGNRITSNGKEYTVLSLDSNGIEVRGYAEKFYRDLIDNNRKQTISINCIPSKTNKIIYLISSVTHSEVSEKGLFIHSYTKYAPGY